ncbi:MAG: GNAT family N-acetyltransferase [Aeromicrobium erythreum]
MTFTLRPVRPDEDADLLHGWVTQERARFWGMLDKSRDEVRDVYTYLDGLSTHHAYLVHLDGEPIALFQTYEPAHDPVGEVYPVQEGDLGAHLFVAPGERVPGFTGRLAEFLVTTLFEDRAVQRVVCEPDVLNAASLRRVERIGAELGPEVDLGWKRARLAFLTRAAAGLPPGQAS